MQELAERNSFVSLGLALLAFVAGCVVCVLFSSTTDTVAQTQKTALSADVTVVGVGDGGAAATEALTGDWPQWGGTSIRNNTPVARGMPTDWDVGSFDRNTGTWNHDGSENVKWVSRVGSQTYGNPVVAGGRVFVGTNNGGGYLPRYPADIDLGCLLAFDVTDGSFLWQHSSEKLPTGRVHDWPLQGICCAPLVEGNRLWFVTSRGEVVCLDTEGFYDEEDDGPVTGGKACILRESMQIAAQLPEGTLGSVLQSWLEKQGVSLAGRLRVDDGPGEKQWQLRVKNADATDYFRLSLVDGMLSVSRLSNEDDTSDGQPLFSTDDSLTAGLSNGQVSEPLLVILASRGCPLQQPISVREDGPGWKLTGVLNGESRQIEIRKQGPNLAAFLLTTVDDKLEADTVWVYDMMAELGVSQHNMCSCSVTSLGDLLFVNTSNGVDESHINIPNVKAASFIAMDKNTGQLLWSDASPGANILHGQWSSPLVAELGGVPQVIFGGGDGWVYSFRADRGRDGKPELLWKFDANPKTSEWILGGRGTRNNIIATPVAHQGRVYVAVGQDPEHGEGIGHLWCIDPTKRGDTSPQLAVNISDRSKPIPHRRLQAVDEEEGEMAVDNPNSAAIWQYDRRDLNGDGEYSFEETMHRSCGTVAIKDNLLFIADFSGLFHCLDATTGEVQWTYDLLSAAWGSPLIADGKVYIGDEDGELAVFRLTAEPHDPLAEVDMRNSVYSTPIVAHNVLYISNKTHVFAIGSGGSE